MSRPLAITAAALALIAAHAGAAAAQSMRSRTPSLELRVPGGALVGTGAQRDLQKDGQVTAAQLSWAVAPRLAVTGTLAWARSRDIAAPSSPRLDVYMYDVGVELRSVERYADNGVSLRTFAGLGAGARSYNSRALHEGATHHLAGYAAAGGEVGMRRVGVRLEVRDYATGMRPNAGSDGNSAGNDLVVMASLRLNRRASSSR